MPVIASLKEKDCPATRLNRCPQMLPMNLDRNSSVDKDGPLCLASWALHGQSVQIVSPPDASNRDKVRLYLECICIHPCTFSILSFKNKFCQKKCPSTCMNAKRSQVATSRIQTHLTKPHADLSLDKKSSSIYQDSIKIVHPNKIILYVIRITQKLFHVHWNLQ